MRRLLPLLVFAASALYVSGFVERGWVPHDEGMLGQNAERVLRGELPHRDFDESYTGGLTALHALAFRVFGVRLTVLRWVLFALFLLFVLVFQALAARWLTPWPAALLTAVAVVWSFPNYFASMPSWYVLGLSVVGLWALVREIETGRRRWLVLAGACAGLSLTVLVVGLYFVAAALLHFAFREQEQAVVRAEGGGAGFFVFQALSVAAFLAVLLALVRAHLAPMDELQLVVPPAAVCAVLLRRAWAAGRRGRFRERLRALAALALPFGLGLSVPLALLLAPYLRHAALADLYRGLFVLPFRQLAAASHPFPPLESAAAVLPLAALLLLPARRTVTRFVCAALGALLAAVLLLSGSEEIYRAVWHSARSLGVVAVVIGCARLWPAGVQADGRTQERFLLLAVVALFGLLQFPYAAPVYFCYVAPLVALSIASIARPGSRIALAVVGVFYFCFAVWRLNPGYIWELGVRPAAYGPLADLDLPRAGLRVPAADRDTYSALAATVAGKARSPFLYAAPDCPEVPFLLERRNPTRVVFDYAAYPETPETLLRSLRERMVDVIVVNERPDYSPPIAPAALAALEEAFPRAERIGKFLVRWRETAP